MTPYDQQKPKAFWRTAVAKRDASEIRGLWSPRFEIGKSKKVVTAGSCFAQHISRAMQENGFNWLDAEPPPALMSADDARALNYGIFSFRTGNIYTTALLRQWVAWAVGDEPMPNEVWEKAGRFYDPFRPVVEPNGFSSAEEVKVSRQGTIEAVHRAIAQAEVFVFTLGLTESWKNTRTGVHYPMCPGTAAGKFDPEVHAFENLSYQATRKNLEQAVSMMRRINPALEILLTVSPVPLTATATRKHVLVATTHSKSTLRSVAGDMVHDYPFLDYFPSYEIITAPPFRGRFFESNMREVSPEGVAFVMRMFFAALEKKSPDARNMNRRRRARLKQERTADDTKRKDDDVACEDELLDAFGP